MPKKNEFVVFASFSYWFNDDQAVEAEDVPLDDLVEFRDWLSILLSETAESI